MNELRLISSVEETAHFELNFLKRSWSMADLDEGAQLTASKIEEIASPPNSPIAISPPLNDLQQSWRAHKNFEQNYTPVTARKEAQPQIYSTSAPSNPGPNLKKSWKHHHRGSQSAGPMTPDLMQSWQTYHGKKTESLPAIDMPSLITDELPESNLERVASQVSKHKSKIMLGVSMGLFTLSMATLPPVALTIPVGLTVAGALCTGASFGADRASAYLEETEHKDGNLHNAMKGAAVGASVASLGFSVAASVVGGVPFIDPDSLVGTAGNVVSVVSAADDSSPVISSAIKNHVLK